MERYADVPRTYINTPIGIVHCIYTRLNSGLGGLRLRNLNSRRCLSAVEQAVSNASHVAEGLLFQVIIIGE